MQGFKTSTMWHFWMCHALSPAIDSSDYMPSDFITTEVFRNVRRAIFIYSKSLCRQLVSLHRRNFTLLNAAKRNRFSPYIIKKFKTLDSFSLYNETYFSLLSRFLEFHTGLPEEYLDLLNYLEEGEDWLQMASQWEKWTRKQNLHFPILTVSYENLWEKRNEIVHFLNLPQNAALSFPKHSNSNHSGRYIKLIKKCNEFPIYDKFKKQLKEHPPLTIIWNNETHVLDHYDGR